MSAEQDNATLVEIENKREARLAALEKSKGFLSDHEDRKGDVNYIGNAFATYESASLVMDKLSAAVLQARQKLGPANLYENGDAIDDLDIDGQPKALPETTDNRDDVAIAAELQDHENDIKAKMAKVTEGQNDELIANVADDNELFRAQLTDPGKDPKFTPGGQENDNQVDIQINKNDNLNAEDGDDIVYEGLDDEYFISKIQSAAVQYVSNRGLSPALHGDAIAGAVDELLKHLQEQGNNDHQQMMEKLDVVLGDVPKTLANRLPDNNDNDDANDDEWDGIICDEIMNELVDCLNQRYERAELQCDKKPLLDEAVSRLKDRFGSRLGNPEELAALQSNIDDAAYMVTSEEADKNKPNNDVQDVQEQEEVELVNNGFELTGAYWTKKKGKHADSKGKLVTALQQYESMLAFAKQARGVDKMKGMLLLQTKLDNILSVAASVQKGLNSYVHKKSSQVLDGVPYAVKQERAVAQKMWDDFCKQIDGKTYNDIGTEPFASVWNDFIASPSGDATRKNHKFITGYNKQDRSPQFHKWASTKHELNIDADLYGFDINDNGAWERIYKIAMAQMGGMFGHGFNNMTVQEWARSHAKELADKAAKE